VNDYKKQPACRPTGGAWNDPEAQRRAREAMRRRALDPNSGMSDEMRRAILQMKEEPGSPDEELDKE
jgi:hypothetical protein